MALVSHQRCLLAGVNDSSKSSLLATQSYFPGGSVGQQMHNVQPDRPIGYGAFGVVWSVTDPRSGKKVALKRMPNVFLNLASCKRVFREIRMLCSFKNDNVLSCLDILHPPNARLFVEIYVLTELMQSDLHKIIVSPQPLTADHVKVFIYQILRGVKYLHSANILHRDIKPGNLLVNSNCLLKICDFGLARIWDPSEQGHLTHEVVTQYYRAPELLMGARKYTAAVDVWSIGCIFAELLGRRILFQAQGPVEQLNLIIDLLGTPSVAEMKYACEGARSHVLKSPFRSPKLFKLYSLSPHATQEAVDLLAQMLCFDPVEIGGSSLSLAKNLFRTNAWAWKMPSDILIWRRVVCVSIRVCARVAEQRVPVRGCTRRNWNRDTAKRLMLNGRRNCPVYRCSTCGIASTSLLWNERHPITFPYASTPILQPSKALSLLRLRNRLSCLRPRTLGIEPAVR